MHALLNCVVDKNFMSFSGIPLCSDHMFYIAFCSINSPCAIASLPHSLHPSVRNRFGVLV